MTRHLVLVDGLSCTLQVQRGSVLLRHSMKELPHPSGFVLICIGVDDQLAQSVWHKFHWLKCVQVGGGVATTMTRDASVTLTPGIQYSHSMGSSMSLCTVKVNFSKLLLFFRA